MKLARARAAASAATSSRRTTSRRYRSRLLAHRLTLAPELPGAADRSGRSGAGGRRVGSGASSWTNRREVRAARRRLVRRRFGRVRRASRPRSPCWSRSGPVSWFRCSSGLRRGRLGCLEATVRVSADRVIEGGGSSSSDASPRRTHALARRRAALAGTPRSGWSAHAARARAPCGRDADARVRDQLPSLGRLHRLDPALSTRPAPPPSCRGRRRADHHAAGLPIGGEAATARRRGRHAP